MQLHGKATRLHTLGGLGSQWRTGFGWKHWIGANGFHARARQVCGG